MERLAVFSAAIIPALMLLGYGVAKTGSGWGSEGLWNAFFLGMIGAVAAVPIELGLQYLPFGLLPPLLKAAAEATLVAAIPEETIKFVILVGIAERQVDVRRLQDILVVALAVSLGFAALENLFYVMVPADWQWVAAIRALTAVPGHGIFGLVMGALVMAARLRPHRRVLIISALVLPILLHAAYDFPLFALKDNVTAWLVMIWMLVLLLSVAVAILLCNVWLPKAAAADRASGRDRQPDSTPVAPIVYGCVMLVISPSLGFLSAYFKDTEVAWVGAVLSIVPVALSIDLIWTGVRRSRATIHET
jgi:protease PrsW